MRTVTIKGERGISQVLVGAGCLERFGEELDLRAIRRPLASVTNTTIAPLHGRRAARAAGAPVPLELPDGEVHKRWDQVSEMLDAWLAAGVHRGGSVLAVGGGVVTDTAGFAAAVYLRGIEWLAAPTTLLAMVDASVGGKTGINLEVGKNLAGAFWAPRLVAIDPETLATLPVRELAAGVVEVVKAAWIGDRGLLELLENPAAGYGAMPPDRWEELIVRSVQVKARVVEADERESGARKALNLGHTLGHGLEAVTGYERFLHGEAVAWGLLAVARMARRRGLLSEPSERQLLDALPAVGELPPIRDLDPSPVLAAMARDKKRDDLGVGWVLPTDDGVVLDQRVAADEVREVFAELQHQE